LELCIIKGKNLNNDQIYANANIYIYTNYTSYLTLVYNYAMPFHVTQATIVASLKKYVSLTNAIFFLMIYIFK
jgi:hypothetical protein